MKQAAPQARHGSVNAGSDPDTQPDATYGRAPAVIIQIRLRAGAAILGRLGTRPAVHTESPAPDSARVHNGRSGAHDFHPPRRRSKALLRRECRSRVTHDHPRSTATIVAVALALSVLDEDRTWRLLIPSSSSSFRG